MKPSAVTEYVGFVAAWKHVPDDVPRLLYASIGALITAYATFLPTFLFIFLAAPYIWLVPVAALAGMVWVLVGLTP